MILGCAEWKEEETLSSDHYLDIRDPRSFSVLRERHFDILRRDGDIPEDMLGCLEGEFLDRQVPSGWDSNGLIYAVRDYLEESCGLTNMEKGRLYSAAAWRIADTVIEHKDRNCKDGAPYLLHRGHVYDDTKHTHPNHVFIQYWMYSTASYAPYGIPLMGGKFIHEADWEMGQLTLRMTNPEVPRKKLNGCSPMPPQPLNIIMDRPWRGGSIQRKMARCRPISAMWQR